MKDEELAHRIYFYSCLGIDKVLSTSDRSTMRDVQHPESGVLNGYPFF